MKDPSYRSAQRTLVQLMTNASLGLRTIVNAQETTVVTTAGKNPLKLRASDAENEGNERSQRLLEERSHCLGREEGKGDQGEEDVFWWNGGLED